LGGIIVDSSRFFYNLFTQNRKKDTYSAYTVRDPRKGVQRSTQLTIKKNKMVNVTASSDLVLGRRKEKRDRCKRGKGKK
jgi:hypothetical protein